MPFPDSPPSSPLLSSSTSLSGSDDPDLLSSGSDPPTFSLHSFSGPQDGFIASSETLPQVQWGDPIFSHADHSAVDHCDITARWSDSDSSSKSTIQQKDCVSSPQNGPNPCDYMHQEPNLFQNLSISQEINQYRGPGHDRSTRTTLTKNCRGIGMMRNAGSLPYRGD
jgi:hypothetical protein